MTTHDEEYDVKREKIEKGITKCRDTINVMEVKLKKVLDRVMKKSASRSSGSPSKKQRTMT